MRKINCYCYFPLICLMVICILDSQPLKSQQIKIGSGTHLISTEGTHIVLHSIGIQNEGAVILDTADWTGGDSSSIAGDGVTVFKTLNLNKPDAGLKLSANVKIASRLSMVAGSLSLLNAQLDLGDTGEIYNESYAHAVLGPDGVIKRTADLQTPDGENPGNIGVEISTATNLGTTTLSRNYESGAVADGEHPILGRTYSIFPASNEKADASLKFYYNEAELPDTINENDLYIWHLSPVTNSFEFYGRSAIDTVANYVQLDHVDTLGVFAFSTYQQDGAPLPVKLVSLSGQRQNQGVALHWKTASELNTDYFFVEHSGNGVNFTSIGKLAATGSSSQGASYDFFDNNAGNAAFYRLKITDKSGHEEYSDIIHIGAAAGAGRPVTAYPNPASATVSIRFSQKAEQPVQLSVWDVNGRRIYTKTVRVTSEGFVTTLSLKGLANGLYFIRFDQPAMATISIIKK